MYQGATPTKIEVVQTEQGQNFVTFYFKYLHLSNEFAQRLYKKFEKNSFKHFELQRKNFEHRPGDPEHFHEDGPAISYWKYFRHFHIIYPGKPTEEDWEYLYRELNDTKRNLVFKRDLPTREVIHGQ